MNITKQLYEKALSAAHDIDLLFDVCAQKFKHMRKEVPYSVSEYGVATISGEELVEEIRSILHLIELGFDELDIVHLSTLKAMVENDNSVTYLDLVSDLLYLGYSATKFLNQCAQNTSDVKLSRQDMREYIVLVGISACCYDLCSMIMPKVFPEDGEL